MKSNEFQLSILTVNFNTSKFIELIIYATQKLNYYPTKILIADNSSEEKDYVFLKEIAQRTANISIDRLEHELTGSMAHGYALNYLLKKVDTPYFAILDSDATFLIKDWDKILMNKISEKIKVIGSQAAGNKPKDFPLMYACFFETSTFKSLNIDFRPKDIQKGLDTGWELREKYQKAGYEGLVLEFRNTRHYKEGPFNQFLCAEYYLEEYKQIFASHFGRGATLGASKYFKGSMKKIYNLPFIGRQLLKNKGLTEKSNWIKTCRKIIDFQSIETNETA